MHELAVAQGLIAEATRVASAHGASAVDHIVARIGALSGVEPQLLERAFTLARAGGLAQGAALTIETTPIVVTCSACGADSEAAANRLVCGACGDWRVQVVSGEELLLVRVELSGIADEAEAAAQGTVGSGSN